MPPAPVFKPTIYGVVVKCVSVCVCVCVCVFARRGNAILKRKTCMGLRAACFEKRGGVPADEPAHLMVGGERAPLPRMRPSPRPKPL